MTHCIEHTPGIMVVVIIQNLNDFPLSTDAGYFIPKKGTVITQEHLYCDSMYMVNVRHLDAG